MVGETEKLVERLRLLIDLEQADFDRDSADAEASGERADLWPREIALTVGEAKQAAALIQSQAAELASVKAERDANHHLAVANGERAKEEFQRAERAEARIAELEAGLTQAEEVVAAIAGGNIPAREWAVTVRNGIRSLLNKDRQK